jgi:Transposase DDE domain
MSQPSAAKYRTTNWRDYNATLVARGSLMRWIDRDMQWLNPCGNGKRGRNLIFSDAAIAFCLMLKALYNLPLRQASDAVA